MVNDILEHDANGDSWIGIKRWHITFGETSTLRYTLLAIKQNRQFEFLGKLLEEHKASGLTVNALMSVFANEAFIQTCGVCVDSCQFINTKNETQDRMDDNNDDGVANYINIRKCIYTTYMCVYQGKYTYMLTSIAKEWVYLVPGK